MVKTLTDELESKYREKILTPVIIESKSSKLSDVVKLAKDYIKPGMVSSGSLPKLGDGILNNIRGKIQSSMATLKAIPSFNMVAMPLFRNAIEEMAQERKVDNIYLDRRVNALQTYSTVPDKGIYQLQDDTKFTSTAWTKKLMGCDKANEMGFSGQDMKVSVPDTGANRTHSSVRDNITVKSMMRDKLQYKDKNGHGLWCSGCIGGSKDRDKLLNVPTEGMAPKVNLLSLKVLGYVMGTGMTSDIIESMEYSGKHGADVISMSLGGEAPENHEDDPQCKVISKLDDKGHTFVVAGGNSGPDAKTLGSPGTCPNALTVGAFDPRNGEIAEFSSRGPTPDGRTKPDVVAPGVMTHAPILGALDGANDKRSQRFSPISGTSMATPHTAGLVALMKQAKRKLVGEDMSTTEIKTMMEELGTTKDNTTGWGFMNWRTFMTWLSTEYDVGTKEK